MASDVLQHVHTIFYGDGASLAALVISPSSGFGS